MSLEFASGNYNVFSVFVRVFVRVFASPCQCACAFRGVLGGVIVCVEVYMCVGEGQSLCVHKCIFLIFI